MLISKFLSFIPARLRRSLLDPAHRYSSDFWKLEGLFSYDEKERVLKNVVEYVMYSELEGDYLEFGVFEGGTLASVFHLSQAHGLEQMKFYAFDSFSGLPEVKGVDAAGFKPFAEGQFTCDVDKFKRSIQKKKVDLDKVHIVPGWYDETLNEQTKQSLPLKKAAIIYIDCDLYESTVPVLNFIESYLQVGTVLLFDDWFCFRGDPERGEQRAMYEWLARTDIKLCEYQKYTWQSNSFLVTKIG